MLKHPDYLSNYSDWYKWRLTYEGGQSFIEKYLRRYSNREDVADFNDRKAISYCPAFTKSGINEVKDSIYQRMVDITRVGGSKNFLKAIEGEDGGVDLKGNSMNSFMGQEVLTELLVMGKVGIFIDMSDNIGTNLIDARSDRPYFYIYTVEQIHNWHITDECNAVLLLDRDYKYDELTGFPIGITESYRRLWKNEEGTVSAQRLTTDMVEDGPEIKLELSRLPFVLLEISDSLMIDLADYQITLLNVASSDIGYTLKANFPFYTEQFDQKYEASQYLRSTFDGEEDDDEELVEPTKEIKVGSTSGRRYPMGAKRPSFIHPSADPMRVSMEKQAQLKQEIRTLLNLSLANVKTVGASSSAESKKEDNRTLEAGLSNIGLTLEKGERQITEVWSEFEGNAKPATIRYPSNYSLKSEKDRREEADSLTKLMPAIPSKTYQQEIGKQISRTMLGHYVSTDTLETIDIEIEKAPNMVSNPEQVAQDVENGLVSPKTASQLRGYPDGESEKAAVAHTERLARIAEAQSAEKNMAARGVADMDDNQQSGEEEKEESRETDQDDVIKDKTRGKNKE